MPLHNNNQAVGASTTSDRPLRFCMVTTFYPPCNFGGDGIFVQRLAHSLAARGHAVTVIHCEDAYRLIGGAEPAPPAAEPAGVTVLRLRSRAGALSPLLTHQLGIPALKAGAIRAVIDAGNFDVIHFHNISLVGGPGVLAYGDAVKLYTCHEHWLLCPLSTLWKFDSEPCRERACLRCTARAGRPPQWWRYTPLLDRMLAHVDAVLAPSRFMIDLHRAAGIDANFIHTPNFLPLADHRPAPAAPRVTRPFFLMVGRLEASKGFQRAISLFRNYTQADLLLAGTGPYADELRALAGDAEHIRLLGHVPYPELRQLYRDALAVIVPSLWDEPFGLIVIEAFAERTPVIVHAAGALPELVADSAGGLVYRSDAELHTALELMRTEPERRAALGEAGYAAYRAHWTEEQYLRRYFALIDTLRAGRPANAAGTR